MAPLRRLRHAGRRHACPVCRARLRAFTAAAGRPGARCPVCGSLERHRHLWLFLERHTSLPADREASVLHLAPEAGLAARLAAGRPGYLSADLEPGAAMRVLDLQDLDLPDASFDWVLCSHVLEHVPDDRAAMREIRRVLRPGGTAVVQSPVHGDATDEDPALEDPAARLARFGQDDHVRLYGRDLYDRLREAGLEVDVRVFRDELSPAERERFGLDYRGTVVDYGPIDDVWSVPLCRRP